MRITHNLTAHLRYPCLSVTHLNAAATCACSLDVTESGDV